ncbi:hypothetical protein F2P56_016759 [Juglans regia]|uniref:J domain-containing protein n=1 Tax=Juglans regia TaxID=51240 RepID=A0A833XJE8_JUGRE|nr:hypothetical protein F2P56_016759 [Juglans regia]
MAAAAATGFIGGNGSSSSSWFQLGNGQRRKKKMVNRVMFSSASSSSSSSSVMDPYKTLRIQPSASESEIKKAFRQLALQVLFLGKLCSSDSSFSGYYWFSLNLKFYNSMFLDMVS